MTTTVTTVTVTTVTTLGFGLAIGLIVTIALIGLLLSRELAGAGGDPRLLAWKRTSMVAIVPLLLSFAVIVAVKMAGI